MTNNAKENFDNRLKMIGAAVAHDGFKREIVAVMRKHCEHLSAPEMLAVAAQIVGMAVAAQDQHTMPPAAAMSIVEANILEGNRAAVAGIEATLGSA